MEAQYHRQISSGKEFDHLFPKAENIDSTVSDDAGVEDTVQLIRDTVPQSLDDTRKIAKELRGKNLYDTCKKIWDFVYHHIQYKRDKKGVEQVRSPRRVWANRITGVDCDCYTEFISSILSNLGIPHKLRIAAYTEENGYQHIYPVVPKNGRLNYELNTPSDYITIDCVKDSFDSEQPDIYHKDYNMKLQYLSGIDDHEENPGTPLTGDAKELAELYEDEKSLGSWWSRITNTNGLKRTLHKVEEGVHKAGDIISKGVHFIDKYNPATFALRNGVLEAMKINLFGLGNKLRFAYLTDEEARARSINPDALRNLRKIKDKVETIYWQAGGEKANLRKAILGGRGNKDHMVPLSGLGELGETYADRTEYDILHNPVEGLGEPLTLAAAAAALATVSATIKQVKGLFPQGSKEEHDFQKEVPPPANLNIPINAEADTNSDAANRSALPARSGASHSPSSIDENSSLPAVPKDDGQNNDNKNVLQKTGTWIKEHPIPSVAIGGVLAGMGYLMLKGRHDHKPGALHGTPHHRRKTNTTRRKPKKRHPPKPHKKKGKKHVKKQKMKKIKF